MKNKNKLEKETEEAGKNNSLKMPTREQFKDCLLLAGILLAVLFVSDFGLWPAKLKIGGGSERSAVVGQKEQRALAEKVIPSAGVELPVRWKDLGIRLTHSGVIDLEKFRSFYLERGGWNEEAQELLTDNRRENLKITPENSSLLLNLFWALGLGNQNPILTEGPMVTYDGADLSAGLTDEILVKTGNFASTGGWTLAQSDAMGHYSRHPLIILTSKQQALVERVSKNIYRPCCNNPTHFPDCNHGMAMLGLLELMASQGVSEQEMYKTALQVNSYWFPDTYLTLAQYFVTKGINWEKVNPQEILGVNYSSASGYRRILDQMTPATQKGGGSCGV